MGGGFGAQIHFHKEKKQETGENLSSVLKCYERPVFDVNIKLVPYSKQQKKITGILESWFGL